MVINSTYFLEILSQSKQLLSTLGIGQTGAGHVTNYYVIKFNTNWTINCFNMEHEIDWWRINEAITHGPRPL